MCENILRKYDEDNNKIEEMNKKIVIGLETNNENLTVQNLQLKERLAKINKSKWENKITDNLIVQSVIKTNLNVTDNAKCTYKNLHEENANKFNCYKCEHTFKTLNTLMNHKRKNHKISKCKYLDKCRYNENCWFSHDSESDDCESIKTYYTT